MRKLPSETFHQGVAACTSLVWCYAAHVCTCGSPLFFAMFRFVRCASVLRTYSDCFVLLVLTLGFGCFLRRVFFFFYASFTYLALFCFRYFSSSVFLSTCCTFGTAVFRSMRFSQLIHLMLQLVERFGFPFVDFFFFRCI